jgi:single-stranded-DNA-specific exonuclease
MQEQLVLKNRVWDPRAVDALVADNVPEWLARLYASRGISEASQIVPRPQDLPVPALMKNLTTMATEIVAMYRHNKKILVVGDYDCDGATASAIMTRGLQQVGIPIQFLVPHRFEHGYGLTPEVVRQALERKPDLIITVDCGISSFDGIEVARQAGVPVFVTDHHLPGDTLPDVLIVNPNQPGCTFPSRNLCGAGVALYVVRAVRDELVKQGVFTRATLPPVNALFSWVAIGTIADVVGLDWVNRGLVAYGLDSIRRGMGGPGIQALISVAGKRQSMLSTTDIAFGLGPRINAAGRMASMDASVNLLLDNGEDATRLAHELDTLNKERRVVEGDMAAQAEVQAANYLADPAKVTLVAFEPEWHQGVIGIVAGRLKEKHWRPTVALAAIDDGQMKGSARSIPGLHLRDCLARVDQLHPGLLLKFGGHSAAAGLTLRAGGLELFRQAFEKVAREMLTDEDLTRVMWSDGALPSEALSLKGASILNDGLWGQAMPAPLFVDQVVVKDKRVLMDKVSGEPRHLKLRVSIRGIEMDAIWFNQAELSTDQPVLAYQLSINEYRGMVSPQLLIQGQF